MTVFELIKSFETKEELRDFLYKNGKKTRLGLKKLLEWLNSEVEKEE